MSVYTAIITPFNSDGSVDLKSFLNLVNYQFKNNIDGLVVFGTTGESPTLNILEKKLILGALLEILAIYPEYEEKIILGFSGNNTSAIIDEMSEFEKYPINKFMLSAPYYNKPSQEGLYQHFTKIMSSFPSKEFLIYNIPGRVSVNMEPETIFRICKDNSNYLGVKEASGNLMQIKTLIDLGVPVYSGDDGIANEVIKMGGKGLISVLSNFLPKEMKEALIDDKVNEKLELLYRYEFIETNPVPIKYMLNKFKLIENNKVRLPLVDLTKESQEILEMYFKETPLEIHHE